jgi:hypothetical protein
MLHVRLGRAATGLHLPAPLHVSKRVLFATSGALAVASSAYLSLRPSPPTGVVEPVTAAPDREPAMPLFTESPFARIDPMQMSWWLLPAKPSAVPVSSAGPVSKDARQRPIALLESAKTPSVVPDRRTPDRQFVTRTAQTPRLPPRPTPRLAAQPSSPSRQALVTQTPVAPDVSQTKPPNVQTVASAVDADTRAPNLTPPAASTQLPRPPGTTPTQSNQQIYAALHQYARAYDRLDANAVRAVWPSVDARALERAFRDLKSQTLEFDRCDIDVASMRAKAACRGRATYETRAGEQAARTEPREWTFTLQKSHEAWRIVTANAR